MKFTSRNKAPSPKSPSSFKIPTLDSSKPRTELNVDPDQAVNHLHLSVRPINPDIISDIDSVDSLAMEDLDSGKILANLEKNRRNILEKTSEEISYFERSDIYSDMSESHAETKPMARSETAGPIPSQEAPLDISSDLSSVLDLSKSESNENLKTVSSVKVNLDLARETLGRPAPVLELINHNSAPQIDTSKKPHQSRHGHFKDSYDEDAESLLEITELEKPQTLLPSTVGTIEPRIQKTFTNSEANRNDEFTTTGSNIVPSIASVASGSQNSSQRVVTKAERQKYEKEIQELKNRIIIVEKESNDFILHTEEKLKQFELLENLAKSEVDNHPRKLGNYSLKQPKLDPSTMQSLVTLSQGTPASVAIMKQYEKLQIETEERIENINEKLRDEKSKTARFEILKIENESQAKDIKYLNTQIYDLELENDKVKLQFAQSQRETLSTQESLKKSSQNKQMQDAHINEEIKKLKSYIADLELSLANTEKTRKEEHVKNEFYRSGVNSIAKRMSASDLTFEQKDSILLEIRSFEREPDTRNITESFQKILENIHKMSLQNQSSSDSFQKQLAKLQADLQDSDATALKQRDENKNEIQSLSQLNEALKKENSQYQKKVELLERGGLEAESSLTALKQNFTILKLELDECQEKSHSKESQERSLLVQKASLENHLTEQTHQLKIAEQTLINTEKDVQMWKLELDRQTGITKELQAKFNENVSLLKESRGHASDLNTKNIEQEELINNLKTKILELQKHIAHLQNDDIHDLLLKIHNLEVENGVLESSKLHENEVNGQLSSRLSEALKVVDSLEYTIENIKQEKVQLKEEFEEKYAAKEKKIGAFEVAIAEFKNNIKASDEKMELQMNSYQSLAKLNTEMKKELRNHMILIKQLEMEKDASEKHAESLLTTMSGTSQKLEKTNMEVIKEWMERYEVLQKEYKETTRKLEIQSDMSANLGATVSELRAELEIKNLKLDEFHIQLRKLKDDFNNVSAEEKHEKGELQEVKHENQEQLTKLQLQTQINSQLNATIAGLTVKVEDLQIALERGEKVKIALDQEISELIKELRTVSVEAKLKQFLERDLELVRKDLQTEKDRAETINLANSDFSHKINSLEKLVEHSKQIQRDQSRVIQDYQSNEQISQLDIERFRVVIAEKEKELLKVKNDLKIKIEKETAGVLEEHQALNSAQNQVYRLEMLVKQNERELFNERSRFQAADLNWQESVHQNTVLQKNNTLLEKELASIRSKYDSLNEEQKKIDLATQETVMKLQNKVAEQRQLIQDIQIMANETRLLRSENDKSGQKLAKMKKDWTAQDDIRDIKDAFINGELIERFGTIENEIESLTESQKKLVAILDQSSKINQSQKEAEDVRRHIKAMEKQFSKVTKKMRKEYGRDATNMSKMLDRLFAEQKEYEKERQTNETIIRQAYEKKLKDKERSHGFGEKRQEALRKSFEKTVAERMMQ